MAEIVDYKLLSIYIVFGFFILLGYGLMIKKYWKSSKIWTNNNKNSITDGSLIKRMYIPMIFLSFIAGTYLIYYLSTTENTDTSEILVYVGSVVFLVCSTVWAYWPFDCPQIILGAVAIGSILILAGIVLNSEEPKEPKKAIALTASSIIIVQTFLFDFLIWTGLLLGPYWIK